MDHSIMCREAILDAIEGLTLDELRVVGRGEAVSILGILVDIINNERYWISILSGTQVSKIEVKALTNLMQIREAMAENRQLVTEYIDNLTPELLQSVNSFRSGNQTISFTTARGLLHVITSEAHQRGVLVNLIRDAGKSPPDVNML